MLVLQKVYIIPTVKFVRTNHQGDIYEVETPEYTDIVIVDCDEATCTCHGHNCEHIRAVNRRRIQNAAKNARRTLQTALFDLSYGDIA